MSQFYNSRQLWRRRQVWRQRAQTPTIVREPESDKKDEEVSEEMENAAPVAPVLKEEPQSFTLFHDIAKEIEEKINEITAKKEERKVTFAPFVSVYRIPSLVDIRAAFDHHESKENENQRLKTIIITSSSPSSSSSSLFPNYHQDLYWSPRDYETFKQDAILEIRTFWKLFGKSNSVMKDPATILYQPCNKGSCDEIQNDFIYELITLSKHTNNPQYYSSLSNTLTTLFDCPDVKEKLFATPMMNTSFLRHVDTLSRLEDFISEDPVYDITETEKMGGSKVLPYYGDEDDDSEEDDMETVTTKDSMGSLASTPPDRQYPSSLIIGESDPESCSDGSPYSFY